MTTIFLQKEVDPSLVNSDDIKLNGTHGGHAKLAAGYCQFVRFRLLRVTKFRRCDIFNIVIHVRM